VKVWWFPHTRRAQVLRYERTLDPPSTRPSPATQRWIDEAILQQRLFPMVNAVEAWQPDWIPMINRFLVKSIMKPRRVGASQLMLSTPMPLVHRETEAALPIHRADEALDRVVKIIDEDRLRVNFLTEIRFVRGDDAWMSPAQGADTCQIGAYIGNVPDADRYFAAFWRELRPLGARPHWGKEMDHRADELRRVYPHMDRFLALREEMDPARIFSNDFQARALGA
jgi:hypothetical protein